MSWSNWIYLLVGLGLGLGSRWLFRRSKESNYNLPTLLELKQTKLAYQQALQMSQFKAGFLVRTSHELRSPLNSLIGLHQLILADLCDDHAEERKFVAQAQSSALKLVKLLDEILDVARIEHGSNNLEIQPIQLAHLLQEVYQLTYLLAANRNFPLQLSPPDPEIYVLADPRWLRQVLVNLVDNCIAQMQEGSICISASKPVTDAVHIWLDIQPSISTWSEPMNLIHSEELVHQSTTLPAGLSLLLNQTLLESMNGSIKILPVPVADELSTRIELSIPWVIPETASPEQEESQS